MKFTAILFAVVFSANLFAQDRSIAFRDLTFDDALKVAKEEGKPIFMDCYAVWCGPCKWMSANIFTKNDIADYFNENFVCLKVDMEKGEGIELAKEFGIRAYPTLIFVNAERQLIMKSIGASQKTEDYIAMGENARSEDNNLIALAANVAANRDNAAFMSNYFDIMSHAGMVDQEEVNIYFSNIPKDEWASPDNWRIIMSVVDDIRGEVFQDILNDTEKYRAQNGEIVDQFVTYKIQNAVMNKLYSRAPDAAEQYEALMAEIETWEFPGKEALIFTAESTGRKRQSPEAYMEYCMANVEEYVWEDANQLNNIAWYFFENTEDKKYLAAAEKWAARAVELNPAHHILDTYANLLLANGKHKEALETEERALAIAEKEGADTESYRDVIARIKAAM